MMNLGELGTAENAAITHDWKFYHSLPALTIWVVVGLTVGLVKSNRHLRALAVLAPLVVLAFAWPLAANLLGISGINRQIYSMMFYSIIAGVSMLWLLSDQLSRLHFLVRPLAALGILEATSLAGTVGQGFGGDLLPLLCKDEFALLLAVVISLTLAGILCFKRYGGYRYGLWLLPTTLGTCMAAIVFPSILMLRGAFSIDAAMDIISQNFIFRLLVSAFLCVIHLVFLLFTLNTPFYRERFCKCLGLRLVGAGVNASDSPVPATDRTNLPRISEDFG